MEPEHKSRVPDFKFRDLSYQKWKSSGEEVYNYLSHEQTITDMIIWKSTLKYSDRDAVLLQKKGKEKREREWI